MFLALRKFALKEDELELEYHNLNLMMNRDLGFHHEDICRTLEKIPLFYFKHNTHQSSKHNHKHQSRFLFSLKVDLMLLLAVINGLKSFRLYFLMFANKGIY